MLVEAPKVLDLAYAIFAAPNLDQMRSYLEDFGMSCAKQSDSALQMRGFGRAPFVHQTFVGPARFVGFGVELESDRDIALLAARMGGEVEDAPGREKGSKRLVIQDPDGWRIEAVHDWSGAAPAAESASQRYNFGPHRMRLGAVRRVNQRPAQVKRLGHIALKTPRLVEMLKWYRQAFSMRESDRFYIERPENTAGVFLRFSRGAAHVDHHSVLLQIGPQPGLNHCGFEVEDVDEVMVGHEHMMRQGYSPYWGVGRHVLGSQIFDYWRDPWGNILEHWTDGDYLNEDHEASEHPVESILGQWGPMPPADF